MTQVLGLRPALRLAQKTRTDATFNPPPPTDDKRSSKKRASRMGGKDFKITILKTMYQESEPCPHSNEEVIDAESAAMILNLWTQQTWFKQLTEPVYSYSKHCSSTVVEALEAIPSQSSSLLLADRHVQSSGREGSQPKGPPAWLWLAKLVTWFWALQKERVDLTIKEWTQREFLRNVSIWVRRFQNRAWLRTWSSSKWSY